MHQKQLVVCQICDWVARLPALSVHESAYCPRCGTRLHTRGHDDQQRTVAWALATLVTLAIALSFQFLWFETSGVAHAMVLFDSVLALAAEDYPLLAGLVALTTVILPGLYLVAVLAVSLSVAADRELPGARAAAHLLRPIEPWLMSDVFIVGVLVSLTKIVSLAEIRLGPSFFAFCAYALMLLQTIRTFERHHFWDRFAGPQPLPQHLAPGHTAAAQGVVDCRSCDTPFVPDASMQCPRCGLQHRLPDYNRMQWTLAMLVTAAILLIPANALPIMRTVSLGYDAPATIIGGVRQLAEEGSWPVAAVIFVASIVVPIGKILALGWLCWIVRRNRVRERAAQIRLYRITELIGRWSMIDVFVVAVLTALIQAGNLMAVHPGPASVAFAGAVVLTMTAAITFDPREIWWRVDAQPEAIR